MAIPLSRFINVFVLFAALLVTALLLPEQSPNLDLYRTKYSIWAATILLTPALCLYLFRSATPAVSQYANLFWVFAWAAYLVHFWWAVFIVFRGIGDTFTQQGALIASVNFVLTAWWTLDVLLLLWRSAPRWAEWERLAVRGFLFAIFAVTLLFLREGAVRVLGMVFTALVLLSVLVRLLATGAAERPAEIATVRTARIEEAEEQRVPKEALRD